ncbi:MAG: hypothetical protein HY296_01010 [Thaumarchaeota archaeon]|nr:hypothetical protein [Nitrososphaerota archaeon]
MKILHSRKAISQSMDLFIIIAAVLGIGGVVTAATYGLVSSGASSTTAEILASTLTGGPPSGGGTFTLSLTIKNVGTTPVTLSATSPINVTITGVKGVASSSCTQSGSLTWGSAHCLLPASLVDWVVTSGTVTPGQQVSLIATMTTTGTNPVVSGGSYAVNVLFGASSTSVKLNAQ